MLKLIRFICYMRKMKQQFNLMKWQQKSNDISLIYYSFVVVAVVVVTVVVIVVVVWISLVWVLTFVNQKWGKHK